jgi:hypothetical protein
MPFLSNRIEYVFVLLFLLFCMSGFINAQPVPRRPDITIKSIANVSSTTVRIKYDPVTKHMYILSDDGDIQRVDLNDNGSANLTTLYRTADYSLTQPLGMTFGKDGTMYLVGIEISDTNNSYGVGTIVKGTPDTLGSQNRTWSILAKTVPYTFGHVYNHKMNALIVDTSGQYLLLNSGACTDHGEEREGHREVGLTSIILKLPVNGNNILLQNDREWLRTNGYLFAEGIRNTFDFAYSANGDLFGPENSDDRDDPEELNWLREGHHYGFPWRIGGDNTPQQYHPYDPYTDPLLSPNAWGGGAGMLYQTYSNDPTYPQKPDSITFTEPIPSVGPDADRFRDTTTGNVLDASELGKMITTFTPHRSIDAIAFDRDSILAGDLCGGAFVVAFSNSALITALGDTSQDLLHISLSMNDTDYTAKVTRLISGFNSPLGIEMLGNKLYVVETGLQYPANPSPKLWEITLPEKTATGISRDINIIPASYKLGQNFPNPFNPSTTINYSVQKEGLVKITLYDMLGREVMTLVNEVKPVGNYGVNFYAGNLASGVYFYRMRAGNFIQAKKMILMK